MTGRFALEKREPNWFFVRLLNENVSFIPHACHRFRVYRNRCRRIIFVLRSLLFVFIRFALGVSLWKNGIQFFN